MSENGVDKYFGDLKTALSLKKKSPFFMIALAGLCLFLTFVMLLKLRKSSKENQKMQSIITDDGA